MSADSPSSPSGPAICVQVNGRVEQTCARTLQDWVQALDLPAQALATAVNGEFVARTARAGCVLAEGDQIFTFQAIQGG